jgi:hypothetical protein
LNIHLKEIIRLNQFLIVLSLISCNIRTVHSRINRGDFLCVSESLKRDLFRSMTSYFRLHLFVIDTTVAPFVWILIRVEWLSVCKFNLLCFVA